MTAQRKGKATPGPASRSGKPKAGARYWSARVTRESDALDLEPRVFPQANPKRIAASLKRSAERSRRRKSDPYPLGDVNAHFPYQSWRSESVSGSQAGARTGQDRVAPPIRP